MDDPYRRGINRPNAQRLSISLAPLVAQRSLLFRVKADLAAGGLNNNLGELSEAEESPALYSLTPSASARIISAAVSALSAAALSSAHHHHHHRDHHHPRQPTSAAARRRHGNALRAALAHGSAHGSGKGSGYGNVKVVSATISLASAMSSASVYSQDSAAPMTGMTPALASVPAVIAARANDPRRNAIAFSPSMSWADYKSPNAKGKERADGEGDGDDDGEMRGRRPAVPTNGFVLRTRSESRNRHSMLRSSSLSGAGPTQSQSQLRASSIERTPIERTSFASVDVRPPQANNASRTVTSTTATMNTTTSTDNTGVNAPFMIDPRFQFPKPQSVARRTKISTPPHPSLPSAPFPSTSASASTSNANSASTSISRPTFPKSALVTAPRQRNGVQFAERSDVVELEVEVELQVDTSDGGGNGSDKNAKKLIKKRQTAFAAAAKRISKHNKAFGKVITHLSLQPSARDSTASSDSHASYASTGYTGASSSHYTPSSHHNPSSHYTTRSHSHSTADSTRPILMTSLGGGSAKVKDIVHPNSESAYKLPDLNLDLFSPIRVVMDIKSPEVVSDAGGVGRPTTAVASGPGSGPMITSGPLIAGKEDGPTGGVPPPRPRPPRTLRPGLIPSASNSSLNSTSTAASLNGNPVSPPPAYTREPTLPNLLGAMAAATNGTKAKSEDLSPPTEAEIARENRERRDREKTRLRSEKEELQKELTRMKEERREVLEVQEREREEERGREAVRRKIEREERDRSLERGRGRSSTPQPHPGYGYERSTTPPPPMSPALTPVAARRGHKRNLSTPSTSEFNRSVIGATGASGRVGDGRGGWGEGIPAVPPLPSPYAKTRMRTQSNAGVGVIPRQSEESRGRGEVNSRQPQLQQPFTPGHLRAQSESRSSTPTFSQRPTIDTSVHSRSTSISNWTPTPTSTSTLNVAGGLVGNNTATPNTLKKTHKRTKSSPAVTYFEVPRPWEMDPKRRPPVPAVPRSVQASERASSVLEDSDDSGPGWYEQEREKGALHRKGHMRSKSRDAAGIRVPKPAANAANAPDAKVLLPSANLYHYTRASEDRQKKREMIRERSRERAMSASTTLTSGLVGSSASIASMGSIGSLGSVGSTLTSGSVSSTGGSLRRAMAAPFPTRRI